ncbi:MAG TPA: hypothetical protein VIU11_19140 [Nakamurella sp.]
MGSPVLAFTLVVLAAFAFGVVTVPLGLLLGLPPGLVAIGVFLGSAAFVLVSVPVVLDRVPDRLTRQVRLGLRHGPRLTRWWTRGGRATGSRAAVLVNRGSAVIDRLGYRGAAVLAPLLGRWLVPAAALALDAPRTELYRWAVLGCVTWAVLGTLGTDLLVHLVNRS